MRKPTLRVAYFFLLCYLWLKQILFLSFYQQMGACVNFQDVDFVINYEFPYGTNLYQYQVGRCGRIGKPGISVTFISKSSQKELKQHKQLLENKRKVLVYPNIITNVSRAKKMLSSEENWTYYSSWHVFFKEYFNLSQLTSKLERFWHNCSGQLDEKKISLILLFVFDVGKIEGQFWLCNFIIEGVWTDNISLSFLIDYVNWRKHVRALLLLLYKVKRFAFSSD